VFLGGALVKQSKAVRQAKMPRETGPPPVLFQTKCQTWSNRHLSCCQFVSHLLVVRIHSPLVLPSVRKGNPNHATSQSKHDTSCVPYPLFLLVEGLVITSKTRPQITRTPSIRSPQFNPAPASRACCAPPLQPAAPPPSSQPPCGPPAVPPPPPPPPPQPAALLRL